MLIIPHFCFIKSFSHLIVNLNIKAFKHTSYNIIFRQMQEKRYKSYNLIGLYQLYVHSIRRVYKLYLKMNKKFLFHLLFLNPPRPRNVKVKPEVNSISIETESENRIFIFIPCTPCALGGFN